MPKKVLEGTKPFNEMSLKSCYYNQMVAAYSYFGVDPKIIASNYLPLYEFNDETKVLSIKHMDLFSEQDLIFLTGVKREYVDEVEDFTQFIIQNINANKPVIIPVDCYYLKYREDMYKKRHCTHFVLVYGYDTNKKKFYINEHYYANSYEYMERVVSFSVLNRSYCNFNKILKKEHEITVVLSKAGSAVLNFKDSLEKNLRERKNQFEISLSNFIKCVDFILNCLKDFEKYKNYETQILEFLGDIRHPKITQKNIYEFIYENQEINQTIDRIVENYVFTYGMVAKMRYLKKYNQNSIEKLILRFNELKRLESRLFNLLTGEIYG